MGNKFQPILYIGEKISKFFSEKFLEARKYCVNYYHSYQMEHSISGTKSACPGNAAVPPRPFHAESIGWYPGRHSCVLPGDFPPIQRHPSLFIQGAAGAGKSLFCWRTMQCFDTATSLSTFPVPVRVPIVITLPAECKTARVSRAIGFFGPGHC